MRERPVVFQNTQVDGTGAGLRRAIVGTHHLCNFNVAKLDKEREKNVFEI